MSKRILRINSEIEKYQLHNVIHFTGYLSNDDLRDYLSFYQGINNT